jgi:hypothetical protein
MCLYGLPNSSVSSGSRKLILQDPSHQGSASGRDRARKGEKAEREGVRWRRKAIRIHPPLSFKTRSK